jgi:hypothetical protein
MNQLEDIHYIAERYLSDLQAVAEGKLAPPKPIYIPHVHIIRGNIPGLFCGFKTNTKTPVWAHESRFAKRIRHDEHTQWLNALEALGEPVVAIWA